MAKEKKRVSKLTAKEEPKTSSFSFEKFIPAKYQTPFAIAVIFILFLIFFAPMYFGGKTFQSGDIIASYSHKNYMQEDSQHLWNPYIFLGMPSAMTFGPDRWYDFVAKTYNEIRDFFGGLFSVSYSGVSFYLLILSIASYLFMRHFKAGVLISLFVAVATAFSTGLIVFLFIGHVTKLAVLAFYPVIFLLLLKMQHKIKILYILLLIISLHLFFEPMHVQVIFYTFLAIGIYFIYFFIRSIIDKDKVLTKNLVKSALVFIGATAIALLMSYDKYMQTYEYTEFSTRGTKSILEEKGGQQQSESEFYDYATSWSFSPGEIATFVIPSFYGFGSSTYEGPLSNNQPIEVNTYFGQMPFVDVAMYMGVIVFVLGLVAMFIDWKNRYVQFLTILIVISLLISFGRTFSPVFDLMFYNFPFFDKFRVPSMILILVQLSFPVLAGLGLMRIIELKKEGNFKTLNNFKTVSYVFTGIFILSLLLNSVINDWFISRVNDHIVTLQQSRPQYAQQFNALSSYMAEMFLKDLYFALFFISATFWLIFLYTKEKINSDVLVLLILIFTIIDLWRIDSRGAKYIENTDASQFFAKPEYISELEKINDPEPYRIINLKQDGSPGSINANQNYNVYFLEEDFYGYSAIKPRTYQDILDIVGPVNPILWRMLNVKYVVTEQPVNFPGLKVLSASQNTTVQLNQSALPRAYFVDSVATKHALEVLNMIKSNSFDPKHVAFLEDQNISVEKPDSSAYTDIKEYENEYIKIEANASGKNFLFLGSTYFPKGWNAEIDGVETEIYRANHGFMGVVVPEGKHIVEFIYEPESFYTGKYISLILNSLIVIGLFVIGFVNFKKKDNSIHEGEK